MAAVILFIPQGKKIKANSAPIATEISIKCKNLRGGNAHPRPKAELSEAKIISQIRQTTFKTFAFPKNKFTFATELGKT